MDRLDFVIEWPIREMRLTQLRQWEVEERLSSHQRRRLGDLERLIDRHRPAVDLLLED